MGSEINLTDEEREAIKSLLGSSEIWRSLCRKGLATFCPPNWLVSSAYFLTTAGEEVRTKLLAAQPLTRTERFTNPEYLAGFCG